MSWTVSALGPLYLILLPLSGIVGFIFVCLLLSRGRGPMAAASILLFVHAPLMIGIFAAIQGMTSAYTVMAMSPSTPKPAEIAVGISMSLVAPMVAMLLMIPSYLVAALGTFIRAVKSNRRPGADG